MSEQRKKEESAKPPGIASSSGTISRRSLLKAGATAMPVVLTLQSGEALARTSNLIGSAPGATDGGDVLCLNTSYATELDTKYDLGLDGADFTRLPADAIYHPDVSGGRASEYATTAQQICESGGNWEMKDSGWCKVKLPQNNIVVSSIALNSVSTRIPIVDNSNINIIC